MNNIMQNPVAVGSASQGTAAAITVILVWLLTYLHVTVPGEVAASFSVLFGTLVHMRANTIVQNNAASVTTVQPLVTSTDPVTTGDASVAATK